jgi:hypothetical protein
MAARSLRRGKGPARDYWSETSSMKKLVWSEESSVPRK